MERTRWPVVLMVVFPLVLSVLGHAQLDRIVIPAGTPEDQALTAISNEEDTQKKLAMYQDFLQKFSANPAAVAYGNWQISQSYQTAGDLQKALDYGDKALAGSPRNLDILVSQAGIAQQLKDNARLMDYSTRGGELDSSIAKQAKPEGISDREFAQRIEEENSAAKSSYEFLEAAAFNAIAEEPDAKKRMAYIERFTPAFPNSRFQEQIASYAMMSLSELKDTPRLLSYAEKTLAADPNNLPALLLLATTYADDPKPGSLTKAVTYAQNAIEAAKADAPDADPPQGLCRSGTLHLGLRLHEARQDSSRDSRVEISLGIVERARRSAVCDCYVSSRFCLR